METADIGRRRLVHQHIEGERFQKPEDVVRWLGAMQAQEYLQALWAIGLRTQSATAADVEQAIAAGRIIRTWPMRGTLHFVAPEDAKWMLALSAPRRLAANSLRRRQLEIDEDIIVRSHRLFHDALKGGNRLTRSAMMTLLESEGIDPKGQRGYQLLWYTAQTGLICIGPVEGKQETFVLMDEWVPNARELSREDSLSELARRYFASRGPASVQDLAWWAGITVADAKAGLETIRSDLTAEEKDGKQYWMRKDEPGRRVRAERGAHLLPGFDEYLLGYKDRGAVLAADHAPKIVPGGNGMFFPMIVVDGQVVGTWKRAVKTSSVEITLNPFVPLGHAEEHLLEASERYSRFIGLRLARQDRARF